MPGVWYFSVMERRAEERGIVCVFRVSVGISNTVVIVSLSRDFGGNAGFLQRSSVHFEACTEKVFP